MGSYDQFIGTKPVAPQHAFDEAALARYLRDRIDGFGDDLQVEQFKGGQSNPTFMLTSGGRRYVLRRKPPGELLPSAHAVDREFRVISALAATPVPVARAHLLCEDPSVIGTMFYVMDCVDGRVLWDPRLPDLTPQQRRAHYAELGRVIAALHQVDFNAVGLGDYGKPGNYIQRQVARWTKQYKAAETETIEAVDRLIDWLPARIPPGDETAIVHGDYRFDNVIFHATEPRILAVLDWELSTLGHPLVDFAYHCMTWRMPCGARHPERARVRRPLPRRHRSHAIGERGGLELLHGVQHVPPGRHPARHHQASLAGQRLQCPGAAGRAPRAPAGRAGLGAGPTIIALEVVHSWK
jgi:aminoglycoside phosphotransferase (APT) family kinase protein